MKNLTLPTSSSYTPKCLHLEDISSIDNSVKDVSGNGKWFSNIRLLRDLGYAKVYVEKAIVCFKDTFIRFSTKLTDRLSSLAPKNISTTEDSIGASKALDRKVILRIWEYKDINHPGHASVTIKSRNEKEHVSWWPGESSDGTQKGRLFTQRSAQSLASYQQDKKLEISSRAAELLQQGEKARKKMKGKGKVDEVTEDKACFVPRGRQKKTKDGKWGVSAQKIYFPMIGKNDKAVKQFTMFGLDEQAILKDARYLKKEMLCFDKSSGQKTGKIGYTLASKTENCASITVRMLRSGGAENFVPFTAAWISEHPNRIYEYAKAVQEKIDTLNEKMNKVVTYFEDARKSLNKNSMLVEFRLKLSKLAEKHKLSTEKPNNIENCIKEIGKYFVEEIETLSESEIKSLSQLIEVVKKNISHKEHEKYDAKMLAKEAKPLVEALYNLTNGNTIDLSSKTLKVMLISNTLLNVYKSLVLKHEKGNLEHWKHDE